MAKVRTMAHKGIGDGDPWTRMRNAGYPLANGGEVVAWGQTSSAQVVEAWMNDPPHAELLLGSFTDVGVGMRDLYWCVDLGTKPKDLAV